MKNATLSNNLMRINSCTYEFGTFKTFNMPNTVSAIGNSAFEACKQLETIYLSNQLISIGSDAFVNCSSLKTINLPDTLTDFGDKAFFNCTSLESVHLSNALTKISAESFAHCSALTSITLPPSVLTIDNLAFNRCTALTEINLPTGLTHIGYGAFLSCNALESVVIPATVNSINAGAFGHCTSLKKVIVSERHRQTIQAMVDQNCEIITHEEIQRAAVRRQWCRVVHAAGRDHPFPKDVPTESKALLEFFKRYPGLRRLIGTKVIMYHNHNPSTNSDHSDTTEYTPERITHPLSRLPTVICIASCIILGIFAATSIALAIILWPLTLAAFSTTPGIALAVCAGLALASGISATTSGIFAVCAKRGPAAETQVLTG